VSSLRRFNMEEAVLKTIEMRYFDAKGLQKYFASIHLNTELPHLIVIDDFSDIISSDKSEFFKTLAFIKDGSDYLSNLIVQTRTDKSHQCNILIGETVEVELGPKKIDVFSPWVPLFFLLKGQHNPYSLSIHKLNQQPDPMQTTATFNLNSSSFQLRSLGFVSQQDRFFSQVDEEMEI